MSFIKEAITNSTSFFSKSTKVECYKYAQNLNEFGGENGDDVTFDKIQKLLNSYVKFYLKNIRLRTYKVPMLFREKQIARTWLKDLDKEKERTSRLLKIDQPEGKVEALVFFGNLRNSQIAYPNNPNSIRLIKACDTAANILLEK